jgi:hypothetical protein
LEEHVTSIIMVQEYAKQETNVEAGVKQSSLAYSSTLKMEASCSSETSIYFQPTTRLHIAEDKTLDTII